MIKLDDKGMLNGGAYPLFIHNHALLLIGEYKLLLHNLHGEEPAIPATPNQIDLTKPPNGQTPINLILPEVLIIAVVKALQI